MAHGPGPRTTAHGHGPRLAPLLLATLTLPACAPIPIDRGVCDTYLDCLEAVDPAAAVEIADAFAADGSCWGDEGLAELCRTQCEDDLADLLPYHLAEPACTGAAGDDDGGDDDAGDDDADDDAPLESHLDLDGSALETTCTVTVPSGDPAGGQGFFEHDAHLVGWASLCWVEMYDLTSQYCEGWDPLTGDPCGGAYGVTRPGWEMAEEEDGYDPVAGYWDVWSLTLPYHGEIWPPDPEYSLFICENTGHNFEIWHCCCNRHDEEACVCAMVPVEPW